MIGPSAAFKDRTPSKDRSPLPLCKKWGDRQSAVLRKNQGMDKA